MFSDKRLNQAYQNAKVLEFDDTSRLIFFSDCHRGDNSLSDEFARNQAIYQYAMAYYILTATSMSKLAMATSSGNTPISNTSGQLTATSSVLCSISTKKTA